MNELLRGEAFGDQRLYRNGFPACHACRFPCDSILLLASLASKQVHPLYPRTPSVGV